MALTPTTLLQATGPYTAKQTRFALGAGSPVQTGVFKTHSYTPLRVSAQGTPALAVDITPGGAIFRENQSTGLGIAGSVAAPGVYSQLSDSVTTLSAGITAGHATLPRIDQIFMAVHDTVDAADSTNVPEFRVVAGTATSGATLDNRNGAASDASIATTLGQNWIRLADYLMPAAGTTVTTANIRDRRRWAFGLSMRIDVGGGSVSQPYATATAGTPFYTARGEFSGAPVDVVGSSCSVTGGTAGVNYGAVVVFGSSQIMGEGSSVYASGAGPNKVLVGPVSGQTTPGPGSSLVRMYGWANSGTASFSGVVLQVREQIAESNWNS